MDLLLRLNDAAFETYQNDRTAPFGLWRLCPVIMLESQSPYGVLDNLYSNGEILPYSDGIAALHWFGLHDAADIARDAEVAYRAMTAAQIEAMAGDASDMDDEELEAIYGDFDERFLESLGQGRLEAAVLARIEEDPSWFGLTEVPSGMHADFAFVDPWGELSAADLDGDGVGHPGNEGQEGDGPGSDQAVGLGSVPPEHEELALRYLAADRTQDFTALAGCFANDAMVSDDGRWIEGKAAIVAWRRELAGAFDYTVTIAEQWRTFTDEMTTIADVAGNFPGSPIRLQYKFHVVDGLIARLSIDPWIFPAPLWPDARR